MREMFCVKSCQQRKSKLFSISACSHICIAGPALTITTSVTAALEIQGLDESVKLLLFTSEEWQRSRSEFRLGLCRRGPFFSAKDHQLWEVFTEWPSAH